MELVQEVARGGGAINMMMRERPAPAAPLTSGVAAGPDTLGDMGGTQNATQSGIYPLKVMGLVLLIVFVVEGVIMLILPWLALWPQGSTAESLADATLLSVALAPALWFLIVRPLRHMVQERGRLLRRVFEAQEVERSALARDLHDELGQHLTALLVGLRALESGNASPDVRKRAGDLLHLASDSLKEVRRMASGLRVGVLEDFGLSVAIERLGEDFCDAHGILPEITVKLPPRQRYGHEAETALYRIVQEALTNIAKHARADNIYITVAEEGEELHLTIRDDGQGFEQGAAAKETRGIAQSLGLRSMRERVELLDGTFKIVSGRGTGTCIEARVPRVDPPAAAGTGE